MNIRSVENRCVVDLSAFTLPCNSAAAIATLNRLGFDTVDVNVIEIARSCIGQSIYRRGARQKEAPETVDCSSFVKWLYGMRGYWLPRRSIQQRELGTPVPYEKIMSGDLVFTSGYIDWYDTDPSDGVGHVGIATPDATVIHAANRRSGVVESPLERFVHSGFRGARRYFPHDREMTTLIVPPLVDVECSDDIRWILLRSL